MTSAGKSDLISFEDGWNDEIKIKVGDGRSTLICFAVMVRCVTA